EAAVGMFKKAQGEMSAKRFPAAINSFETVQKMSFNDSEGLKDKARLGAQAAKQKIIDASQALFKEGQTALNSKDYKKGILKMVEALKIYPPNGDAKIMKEKAESELHIEMKNIYSFRNGAPSR